MTAAPSHRQHLLEKVIQAVSFFVGQIPTMATLVADLNFSLYQPAIYRGKEYFVILPIMVGVFASWASMRSERAMYYLFGIFVVLFGIVYWIYERYPSTDSIHAFNWLLYLCAFALLVAAVGRYVARMVGIK